MNVYWMSGAAGSGILRGRGPCQGNGSVNAVLRNAHVLPLWLGNHSAQLQIQLL